jgi:hypothetical protein
LGIGVVAAALAVISAGIAGYLKVQAKNQEAMNQQTRQRIQSAEETLRQAESVEIPTELRGLTAVSAFQRHLESVCKKRNIELTEFSSGSNLVPFVSRFATSTTSSDASDWMEAEVSFRIQGDPSAVIAALRELAEGEVPVEPSNIEIERASVDRGGNARVEARVQIRVLSKNV